MSNDELKGRAIKPALSASGITESHFGHGAAHSNLTNFLQK
jgi:hypothetical protein